MRIELMLIKDRLPKNGLAKVTEKFTTLMQRHYPDAHVRVRLGNANDVSVQAGPKSSKADIVKLLEEMFEDADDWLNTES